MFSILGFQIEQFDSISLIIIVDEVDVVSPILKTHNIILTNNRRGFNTTY